MALECHAKEGDSPVNYFPHRYFLVFFKEKQEKNGKDDGGTTLHA